MRVTELIEFRHNDTFYLYTTSRRQFSFNGSDYKPITIGRSSIVKSESDQRDVELEVPIENEIAQLYIGNIPDQTVTCRISRIMDGKEYVYWNGIIKGVDYEASAGESARATIKASSVISSSRTGLPNTFSGICNHAVYSELCGASFIDNSVTATIKYISENGIFIESDDLKGYPERHFINGMILFDNTYKMIVDYDPEYGSIWLVSQLYGLTAGKEIVAAKGCGRTKADCKTFNNTDNFFGFIDLPYINPFTDGVGRNKRIG